MSRVDKVVLSFVVVFFLAITAVAWCMTHEKVIVCITNSSQQPLENAIIEVNGGGIKQSIALSSFFAWSAEVYRIGGEK